MFYGLGALVPEGLKPRYHSFIHTPNKNLQVLFVNLFGVDIIYSASIMETPMVTCEKLLEP